MNNRQTDFGSTAATVTATTSAPSPQTTRTKATKGLNFF